MSTKSEKLYLHIGNIKDEFIDEADIDNFDNNIIYINDENKEYSNLDDADDSNGQIIELSTRRTNTKWIKVAVMVVIITGSLLSVNYATDGKVSLKAGFEKIINIIFGEKDNNEKMLQDDIMPTLPPERFEDETKENNSLLPVTEGKILSEDKSSYEVDMDQLKSNNIIKLANNTKWSIDLDNNGENEVLEYVFLGINKSIDINGNTNLLDDYSDYLFTGEMCVVVLDNSKDYYGIAITYSLDDNTHGTLIFDYDGSKIIKHADLGKYVDYYTFNKDGKAGMIGAYLKKNGINTMYVETDFKYSNEGGFKKIDMANIFQKEFNIADGGVIVELKKKLRVYNNSSMASDVKYIEAQKVALRKVFINIEVSEDIRSCWYYIEAKDGTCGWIYFEANKWCFEVMDVYNGPYRSKYEEDYDMDYSHMYIVDNGWAYEFFGDYCIEDIEEYDEDNEEVYIKE